MGIKHYNAYTPSRRNMTSLTYEEITKKTPEKSLLAKKAKNATLWAKTSCADFRIAFAFSYINAQNYGYY